MGIIIDGSSAAGNVNLGSNGTVTNLAVGGLPDGTIDNGCMADDAVAIADLAASGTASSSTFLRGDNAWATPDSAPYFDAFTNGIQTFSANTVTKLTVSENVDSGGMFASDRFTPTVAGTYLLMASAGSDDSEKIASELFIGKNGANKINNQFVRVVRQSDHEEQFHFSVITTANGSGDYFELYGWYLLYSGSGDKGMIRKSFKGFRLGA